MASHPRLTARQARPARAGARPNKDGSGDDDERVKPLSACSEPIEHVVFLVPGLLGFDNFSTFRYFADRVLAALRAGLEQRLGSPVPVLALPIAPTASLATRQQLLIRAIVDRVASITRGQRGAQLPAIHLIGHSTGGLDANYLACKQPIAAAGWSSLDSQAPALLERVRTVVSLGSPLQGACITRAPAARVVGRRELQGLPQLVQVLGKFAVSSLADVELGNFLTSSVRELGKTTRFVRELTQRWPLLDDLDPSKCVPLTRLREDVTRRSFVTICGRAPLGEASVTPPDSFFRALALHAAGWETGCAEEGERVLATVAALQRAARSANDNAANDNTANGNMIIGSSAVRLPALLDAGHNDGVVNGARQLLNPDDPEELAGIVIADHFDVLGYYDRSIWTLDEAGRERAKLVQAGLLHSGSSFRDDQFFALYSRIADVIAHASADDTH